MEQSETVQDKDAKVGRLLEERREIRKEKMPVRTYKRVLPFGQTKTSLKRANLANRVRGLGWRSVASSKMAPKPIQIVSLSSKKVLDNVDAIPKLNKMCQIQPVSSTSEKALDTAGSGPQLNKRKSIWLIEFTPKRKASNVQHTPNVKPFIQKSFSESKTASNGSVQINRSVSSVSVIRPTSLTLHRWSVTSSLLGNDSSSPSVWDVSKEPSKNERVQQWMDKRGWSVVSTPPPPQPDFENESEEAAAHSPRNSSVLNV